MDPKGTFGIPVGDALVNVGFYLVDAGIKSYNGEAGKKLVNLVGFDIFA